MGAPVNNNLLVCAIEVNDIEVVELLIKRGIDVNKPGHNTFTPLHMAAYHGRLNIIKILSSKGALLNPILKIDKMHGFTPLHLAVQKNNLECVKLFLGLGASVTPQTEGIFHPIHYAVFYNFVDVARELLQYGADANVRFNNKFSEDNSVTMNPLLWQDQDLPLFHYSILQKHQEMLDVLSIYADKSLRTSSGKTALMQAVEVNDIESIKALATEANVNDKDSFGQPVLHFMLLTASRKVMLYSNEEILLYPKRLSALEILTEKGADVNARFPENDKYGGIIHYAIKYGFSEGVLYLLFRNGDFNFNQIDIATLLTGKIVRDGLSPEFRHDNQYVAEFYCRFVDSMYYVVKKAIDLHAIGLPVNENLILKCSLYSFMTIEEYTMDIDLHKNFISKQIKYMKETKIGDTNITIWDLLTCEMNQLIKFMSVESVRNFDLEAHDNAIFDYFYILKKRLRLAKDKKLFLDETTEFVSSSLIDCLPFDCCQQIVSYL